MALVGWLGSIILAVSSVPQMFKTVRDGHADGLSWAFLALWVIGEILSLVYVAHDHNWPLIANYTLNLGIIFIILRYKALPRYLDTGARGAVRRSRNPLSRKEINDILRQMP